MKALMDPTAHIWATRAARKPERLRLGKGAEAIIGFCALHGRVCWSVARRVESYNHVAVHLDELPPKLADAVRNAAAKFQVGTKFQVDLQ